MSDVQTTRSAARVRAFFVRDIDIATPSNPVLGIGGDSTRAATMAVVAAFVRLDCGGRSMGAIRAWYFQYDHLPHYTYLPLPTLFLV